VAVAAQFVLDSASGLEVSFAYGNPSVSHDVLNTGDEGGYCEVTAWVDQYEVGRQQVWAEAASYAMFSFDLGLLYPGYHRLDVAVAPPDGEGSSAMYVDFEVVGAEPSA
jgi:hypothetical protein